MSSTSPVALFTMAFFIAMAAPSSPALAESTTAIHARMKVPSQLRANMPIPRDVKTFLDRDFRSRYPLAAPIKVDVVDSWVDLYHTATVADGFGGYDTRHYFRVIAQHVTGAFAFLDIHVYERSIVEANQDRILIESFRVVGWQP